MNWINIKDRQPKIGQLVIVLGQLYMEYENVESEYSISFVKYSGENSFLVNQGHNVQTSDNITHWQEINTEIHK
jgi:hypothetical protein